MAGTCKVDKVDKGEKGRMVEGCSVALVLIAVAKVQSTPSTARQGHEPLLALSTFFSLCDKRWKLWAVFGLLRKLFLRVRCCSLRL